jgi:hypothetical protein
MWRYIKASNPAASDGAASTCGPPYLESRIRRCDPFLHQPAVNTLQSRIPFLENFDGLLDIVIGRRTTTELSPGMNVRTVSHHIVVAEFQNLCCHSAEQLYSHTVLVKSIGRNPAGWVGLTKFSSDPGEPDGQNCHSKMMSDNGMASFMPALSTGFGFEERCPDKWHVAQCILSLR